MNKKELEECCDRLSKQINDARLRINKLKKHLESDSLLFKKGLLDINMTENAVLGKATKKLINKYLIKEKK